MASREQHLAERIRSLIEQQRTLAASPNMFQRALGTLIVAAQLRQYLACVTDRRLGRLMFDHVWNVLGLTSPEMTIAMEATQRLLRNQNDLQSRKEQK